jgi:iron complex outermembrane receptor protein
MLRHKILRSVLLGSAAAFFVTAAAASAEPHDFNIPGGDLQQALEAYTRQSGVQIIYPVDQVRRAHTGGVHGVMESETALAHILRGTDFVEQHDPSGAISVVNGGAAPRDADIAPVRLAAASAAASVETVVVTSSKIKGDIQTVPIAITALSQEQLTSRQIAGGPDLVKEVPNLTFSKTNFTGYNIQIRGIGTQAISVTTDPAVAVALNDIPFIRNHFFEQEFYDLSQAEVLRGPQGTLYGRNATAGVVNLISAKPTDQFEAMLSADWGNYHNRRYEGMINVPIVDDRLDIRVAGEWTKRDGYSFNELTNAPIDGRDLWSGRVTIGIKPVENLQMYLVWEHFQEDDDRIRSAKQLCETDPRPLTIGGVTTPAFLGVAHTDPFSQGCRMTSLYSPSAFEVPNTDALPYVTALGINNGGIRLDPAVTPYPSTTQSQNLRVIESAINPTYRAKNDTIELNSDYTVTPSLTLTSQTGFNKDSLWSTEDYNRFDSSPGIFLRYDSTDTTVTGPDEHIGGQTAGTFCDPQLGCSDRLVTEDLSNEHAWQLSQEFRLSSNFSGPFNFSTGGNYLHYDTEENYYVFANSLTLYAANDSLLYKDNVGNFTPGALSLLTWTPNVSDNHQCLVSGFQDANPNAIHPYNGCTYIDPNPLSSLNNEGHNYFLSQNPYTLNSYAIFGEAYYNITSELKLTSGLRWTDDQKHFTNIPSEILIPGWGYPSTGVVNQQWEQWTGRAAADWTPKLNFTDQTLLYASYAHGYKAGGANPPGAVLLTYFGDANRGNPIHPLTFKPEFVDAYELGTKNTLLDGSLTFNGDVFFYNYKNYQISEIVDRTSINLNFNATVKGAELETTWEPAPGLKFSFAGGYEDTSLANGDKAVDLMDRTAGNPDWVVLKPFPTKATNCIMPVYVVVTQFHDNQADGIEEDCSRAYIDHVDPVTCLPYVQNPSGPRGDCVSQDNDVGGTDPAGYAGFDPASAPNNGEGFDKNLGGKQLPNAPHFTTSLSAEYTLPVSEDWAATLHSDFYWQSQSFARVFNDRPYDKIRGYSTTNLALILTSASGWQVMAYLKNVFNVTAITGDFLNSDDSGLTTNVFLTDPRLYGVRVTKNF